MTWIVVVCVHVVPSGDSVPHELSPDCVCQPDEEIKEVNDVKTFHFTHSALDGRS